MAPGMVTLFCNQGNRNRVDEYLNVNEDLDEEGAAAILPLGDRREEEDVRALLGRDGLGVGAAREIQPSWDRLSRRAYEAQFGDVEMDDNRDGEGRGSGC
ncbi:hypothetical protein JAAARDRAFT_39616 [Jaapia argillacea MUCL 33604]|uniref:Uncharacterized protein n=1 Tax=Jaapia argillacea MUCL 33604 TaxID=933084 RepID=A0A067PE99_9AGAM|nr:hypothetical protein JAAARDRAFT_39616 [Jaapia argillacea MUCL 33604]